MSTSSATDRKCVHCGSSNLVRDVRLCQVANPADLGLQFRAFLGVVGTEPLSADLCSACGSLVRLYVKRTDRKWITG
jgi:hypothetical protein